MAATWLGLKLDLPPGLGIPLIFLAGMAFGAALNAVPAILKVKTGAHEVVTTMMFAYAMKTLAPMFIRANGGDPPDPPTPSRRTRSRTGSSSPFSNPSCQTLTTAFTSASSSGSSPPSP